MYKICGECGEQMTLKTISRTFNIRGKEIEIRGIEAYVCDKCDEIVYTSAEAKMIERVIGALDIQESAENARPSRDNDKWIPCDPESIPDTEVLCCDEYGHIVSGYLSEFKGECICESPVIIMRNVVAWTSKPNPYRKYGE